MDAFLNLADKLGIPAVILVFVGYYAVKAGRWFGNRILLPVTDSHVSLIKSLEISTKKSADQIGEIGQVLTAGNESIDKIERTSEEILVVANKNHGILKGMNKSEA